MGVHFQTRMEYFSPEKTGSKSFQATVIYVSNTTGRKSLSLVSTHFT